MALSPISPQELFLQPIGSDVDSSQQENLVNKNKKLYLRTVVLFYLNIYTCIFFKPIYSYQVVTIYQMETLISAESFAPLALVSSASVF